MNIQELVDKEIANNNEERKKARGKKKQESWYASSLGSCLRGQYFSRLGKGNKKFDKRTLRVFHCGNMFEDWVVGLMTKQAKNIETQVRIEDKKLGVSGYVDVVIDNKEVIEIKSKNSRAFWYMKKDGKPMEQHRYQVWIYMYLLGIEKGKIVYVSKDDMSIAQYIVFLNDEKLKKAVLGEIEALNKAWKAKDPSRLWLPDKKSWQHKYCQLHKDFCLKVGE